MHVNIWSADLIPATVSVELPGFVAENTVLSGRLGKRQELDEVLAVLRRLGVRVVSVEVEP